jgi:hypothetical protein
MVPPRSLLAPLAAAAALLAAAAPAGAAARWSPTQGFTASRADGGEPVPRAAIARDGTSAIAFRADSGALLVATGTASGRFGVPRVVDRKGSGDHSIAAAPGGAFLVAWEDRDGLHAAVRTAAGGRIVQRRYGGRHSDINGVQVAADPKGGWVVAERVFPLGAGRDRSYGVRALSLDDAGRPLGPIADLGRGFFGIDARPTHALAVGSDGRAVLAFMRDAPAGVAASDAAVVATRPHGGAFSAAVPLPAPAAVDPRVATDPNGRALVAFTQIARRGDVGSFGAPAISSVRADGTLSPPLGPALQFPGRAFGPSAAFWSAGAALVFQLKTKSEPWGGGAAGRAVSINGNGTIGAPQTLTTGRASEPVAVGLSHGRVLVVWSGAGASARRSRSTGSSTRRRSRRARRRRRFTPTRRTATCARPDASRSSRGHGPGACGWPCGRSDVGIGAPAPLASGPPRAKRRGTQVCRASLACSLSTAGRRRGVPFP